MVSKSMHYKRKAKSDLSHSPGKSKVRFVMTSKRAHPLRIGGNSRKGDGYDGHKSRQNADDNTTDRWRFKTSTRLVFPHIQSVPANERQSNIYWSGLGFVCSQHLVLSAKVKPAKT